MLVRLELDEESQDIFIRAMAKYIPHDIIVSFIYFFGEDFSLILSLLAGRTIRTPSLKIIRNIVGDIKVYSQVRDEAGGKNPGKKHFEAVANKTQNDVASVRKSYQKIKTTLDDWDEYLKRSKKV